MTATVALDRHGNGPATTLGAINISATRSIVSSDALGMSCGTASDSNSGEIWEVLSRYHSKKTMLGQADAGWLCGR